MSQVDYHQNTVDVNIKWLLENTKVKRCAWPNFVSYIEELVDFCIYHRYQNKWKNELEAWSKNGVPIEHW